MSIPDVHYVQITPNFSHSVSNVETYAVCFNNEYDLSDVASLVYNNKNLNTSKHSIVQCTSDTTYQLLQRYTNVDGDLENVVDDTNNKVYLVSLIDATVESDARNETMKQVILLS